MSLENLEKLPELEFEYSPEFELKRVKSILSPDKRKFFLEHGYNVKLPEGLSLEDDKEFSDEELREKVEKEFNSERGEEIKSKITQSWLEVIEKLNALFKETGYLMPEKYKVYLTNYGPGGGYIQQENGIILVFSRNQEQSWPGTLIHEGVHLSIEKLLDKYDLSKPIGDNHEIKELLVNRLVAKIDPSEQKQNRLPQEKHRLRQEKLDKINQIFDQNYPDIEKILEEISKLKIKI